ncbi:MAG: hypothetical protein R2705_23135 [Ilumatobacteraceae bacterium]
MLGPEEAEDLDQPLTPRIPNPRLPADAISCVIAQFGNLAKILRSTTEEAVACPGLDSTRAAA